MQVISLREKEGKNEIGLLSESYLCWLSKRTSS